MRKLGLILFSLLLFNCHHPRSIKAQRLADTLAVLEKKCDFRPLNQDEAYAFMNRYYLPRLDSLPTKRKIFIHPITGVDFSEFFKNDKSQLEIEYSEDSTHRVSKAALIPPLPPSVIFDKKFSWDSKRLLNTKIISDTAILMDNAKILRNLKAWHHIYGYGYMCISYPQYNAHTKRLVIREWVENDDWCGTGRERKFWFTRIPGGWKAD